MGLSQNISQYPGGFSNGVSVQGMPVLNTYSGKVYWVDSNGAGSGTNKGPRKGTFNHPFATLDVAVGHCNANRGDMIMVKANHSETIVADSGVDLDVAGISVVGLGNGEDRPTFTFATDTDADFKIASANVSIKNLVFKCNIASQVMMIEASGTDFSIINCEFREGTATGLNFITVGLADNDCDRGRIIGCEFYAPTAGNMDEAIEVTFDHIGLRIQDCRAYGDFDEACIQIPAGGNAQVDCQIVGSILTNLLTGQHAIQINGTSSTGKIIDCYLQTDAQSTAIDAGGLEVYNVKYHSGTDQTSAVDAIATEDSTDNFIGVDNNDNNSATTNVAANEDGTVLERLEKIQEAVSKGAGSPVGAASSLVDAIGYDGAAKIADAAGQLGSAIGTCFYTTSAVTSNAIPNNIQTGGNFTGASSGGNLVVEEIIVQTDFTGWAAPTNIEITTDNVNGLTGPDAPLLLEGIASFGANKTMVASKDGTTKILPFVLESGKKLFIHGDDNSGTGGGIGNIYVKWRRLADGATIASNDLA